MENTAEPQLQALFDAVILPLARQREAAGREAFPLHPDPEAETYYTTRRKTRMNAEDFEVLSYHDAASLEAALVRLWDGQDDFQGAARRIAEVAAQIREGGADDHRDVDPFVYEMF